MALSEQFLREHMATKRKPRTAAGYEAILRKHLCPTLGATAAADVTRAEVAKLHSKTSESPHNANRALAVISSMYSFAAKRNLVPEGINPARGIEKYSEDGRERYLTSDELQQLGSALSEAETISVPWVIDETNPKAKHTPKV